MSALTHGRHDPSRPETAWLRFSPASRIPGTWKEELYAAAREIASRTTKPLWICSSGGIDSEIACRVFLEQGIPFSVLTLEHVGKTNQHDIQFAKKWCERHGVHQEIVQIDMEKFLTEDIEQYSMKYPAVHPFRYFQIRLMEIVEEKGGYAVLCSGEQLYQADMSKSVLARKDMYLPLSNGNIVPLQWLEDEGLSHEPYFHFATPELCLAYMQQPLVQFALDTPEAVFRHPANKFTLKRIVFQAAWPDLEIRYKFDGYENLRAGVFGDALKRLHERFDGQFIAFNIPVDECMAQLSPRL